MARKRRTALELLQDEFSKTQEMIEQYKQNIKELEAKNAEIQKQIEAEKIKDLLQLLQSENISVEEAKTYIQLGKSANAEVAASSENPC